MKVGIIGATGYAGGELVRLLMGHPQAEIVWYGSRSYIVMKYFRICSRLWTVNAWMIIWRNWRRRLM